VERAPFETHYAVYTELVLEMLKVLRSAKTRNRYRSLTRMDCMNDFVALIENYKSFFLRARSFTERLNDPFELVGVDVYDSDVF